MAPLDFSRFSKLAKELLRLKTHNTVIPIKDTSWEEVIWAALVYMLNESNIIWNSQSHEKSVDIKAKIDGEEVKISAKSGVIKNDKLTISSYRLTTFGNLKERLKFIKSQHKSFDYYLICARKETRHSFLYLCVKVSSKRLAPDWLTEERSWVAIGQDVNLKRDFSFQAKIAAKMSYQLWYSIPLNYFTQKEKLFELEIPKDKLGKGLIDYLEKKFGAK